MKSINTKKNPIFNLYYKKYFRLNDVAATGPETFYTTDYGYYRNHVLHFLEQIIGLYYGHVLYYDGRDFIRVSEPTYMANGITLSKDGR